MSKLYKLTKRLLCSTLLGLFALLGIGMNINNAHASSWHKNMPNEFKQKTVWMTNLKRQSDGSYQNSATLMGKHRGPNPFTMFYNKQKRFVWSGAYSAVNYGEYPYTKKLHGNNYEIMSGNNTRYKDIYNLKHPDDISGKTFSAIDNKIQVHEPNNFKLWYLHPTFFNGNYRRTVYHNWNTFFKAVKNNNVKFVKHSNKKQNIMAEPTRTFKYIPNKVITRFKRLMNKKNTRRYHVGNLITYIKGKYGHEITYKGIGTDYNLFYKRKGYKVYPKPFLKNIMSKAMVKGGTFIIDKLLKPIRFTGSIFNSIDNFLTKCHIPKVFHSDIIDDLDGVSEVSDKFGNHMGHKQSNNLHHMYYLHLGDILFKPAHEKPFLKSYIHSKLSNLISPYYTKHGYLTPRKHRITIFNNDIVNGKVGDF